MLPLYWVEKIFDVVFLIQDVIEFFDWHVLFLKNKLPSGFYNAGFENISILKIAEKVSIEKHLLRHQIGDIFLDTCYYSSGATAWFSLASGVPIVTLCGKSYTARMSSSLLNALDLNELITYNLVDYKKVALKLAKDKDYLDHIKTKLKISLRDLSIFNSKVFAKDLDNVYKQLYIKHFNNT